MSVADPEPITVTVEDEIDVSGLLQAPPRARACFVLAHGAGAGMAHPFMAAVATGLAQRGIASLRYQFPYMERGAGGRIRPSAPMPRARRGGGGRAGAAASSALRRRQVVRWPDDLPGSGGGSSPARARAGIPRIPCIRPDARPGTAASTSSTSRYPCCSCRAHATRLPSFRRSSRCAGR